jgi:hypothetical protein
VEIFPGVIIPVNIHRPRCDVFIGILEADDGQEEMLSLWKEATDDKFISEG